MRPTFAFHAWQELKIHEMDEIGADVEEKVELEDLGSQPSRKPSMQQSTLEDITLLTGAMRLKAGPTQHQSSMKKPP